GENVNVAVVEHGLCGAIVADEKDAAVSAASKGAAVEGGGGGGPLRKVVNALRIRERGGPFLHDGPQGDFLGVVGGCAAEEDVLIGVAEDDVGPIAAYEQIAS